MVEAQLDALFGQDLRGIFAIVGAVLVAWSLRRAIPPSLRGRRGEGRVRRVLESGGFACAHDLLLPIGAPGGWTQVDHVVALPGRLVSIETKTLSGHIYASERARNWTQFIGRQKHRLQNPLHQNFKHLMAIRNIVGNGVPVAGLVVLAGRAKFPKGLPGGCCDLAGLPEALYLLRGMAMGAPAAGSLDLLKLVSSKDPADRRKHLRDLRTRHGADGTLILPMAGALAGGVLLWLAFF
jgi:hypothetical protein